MCDSRVVLSLDDGDVVRVGDLLACEDSDPQESLLRKEEHGVLQELIERLPSRDKELIKLYYYEGWTLQKIAARFGISESRVSQVHSLIKSRLAREWKQAI